MIYSFRHPKNIEARKRKSSLIREIKIKDFLEFPAATVWPPADELHKLRTHAIMNPKPMATRRAWEALEKEATSQKAKSVLSMVNVRSLIEMLQASIQAANLEATKL